MRVYSGPACTAAPCLSTQMTLRRLSRGPTVLLPPCCIVLWHLLPWQLAALKKQLDVGASRTMRGVGSSAVSLFMWRVFGELKGRSTTPLHMVYRAAGSGAGQGEVVARVSAEAAAAYTYAGACLVCKADERLRHATSGLLGICWAEQSQ